MPLCNSSRLLFHSFCVRSRSEISNSSRSSRAVLNDSAPVVRGSSGRGWQPGHTWVYRQMVRAERGYATPCPAICLWTAWKLLEAVQASQRMWPNGRVVQVCSKLIQDQVLTNWLSLAFIWKMFGEQAWGIKAAWVSHWPFSGISNVKKGRCQVFFSFILILYYFQWEKSTILPSGKKSLNMPHIEFQSSALTSWHSKHKQTMYHWRFWKELFYKMCWESLKGIKERSHNVKALYKTKVSSKKLYVEDFKYRPLRTIHWKVVCWTKNILL